MSRKIGNYINPQTGDTNWFEPDTINQVILQPTMITQVNETRQSPIEFRLGNDNSKKTITIIAEYSYKGKKYASDVVDMEEQTFADQFVEKVYSEKAVDEAEIIKNGKDQAVKNLSNILMANNILIGGMKFDGFGFIMVEGDKTLTIEELEFTYSVENGNAVKRLKLSNCVGLASLANLKDPKIEFYTGTYKITASSVTVEEQLEGVVRHYTLKVVNFDIAPDKTMPEHTNYENPDFNKESFLDEFIKERKSLLDDMSDDDSELEDRFGDIF